MEKPIEEILQTPVTQLDLTDGCVKYLAQEKIDTLGDFIEMGWAEHKRMPTFELRFFNEVVSHLRDKNLLYLMEGK